MHFGCMQAFRIAMYLCHRTDLTLTSFHPSIQIANPETIFRENHSYQINFDMLLTNFLFLSAQQVGLVLNISQKPLLQNIFLPVVPDIDHITSPLARRN